MSSLFNISVHILLTDMYLIPPYVFSRLERNLAGQLFLKAFGIFFNFVYLKSNASYHFFFYYFVSSFYSLKCDLLRNSLK